ncbi:MAG: RNA polymerase subunit sigma-54 [Pelagibacterales bacterium]|nr:RNA polymerase subunit sigma-54 [Pelagibacterales bacterium]PPR16410.1 MAG: Riboflavin transporter [Alphaproteobacteria bacterium MarineAlpha9_Bin3]|tara:strand:+ start:25995 stop:26903 length:909 start_codon:yes stop_codon:yes gene_type:complete
MQNKNNKSVLNGIGLMIIATVLFSVMHASIKHMSSNMHPFEIAFFRNLFGLLVIAPWFIKYGIEPLKTKKIKLHMARSFFNVIAMLSFFYSLSIAPLADVASLAFTAPLFASILAVFFLKEIIGVKRILAIIVGFLGAIIIIDPVYSSINNGHIFTLLSASVWSVSLIIIKILGRTESSVTITSYMVIIMIPLSGIAALFHWEAPSINDLIFLMIIGISGTAAQMLLAQALRQGDTSIIMPFDFLKLIWAVVIGYLFFFEVPSINTWLGSIIIFLSTLYIANRERVLSKERNIKNITQPVDQ